LTVNVVSESDGVVRWKSKQARRRASRLQVLLGNPG